VGDTGRAICVVVWHSSTIMRTLDGERARGHCGAFFVQEQR
jgi:hypothetical protein